MNNRDRFRFLEEVRHFTRVVEKKDSYNYQYTIPEEPWDDIFFIHVPKKALVEVKFSGRSANLIYYPKWFQDLYLKAKEVFHKQNQLRKELRK